MVMHRQLVSVIATSLFHLFGEWLLASLFFARVVEANPADTWVARTGCTIESNTKYRTQDSDNLQIASFNLPFTPCVALCSKTKDCDGVVADGSTSTHVCKLMSSMGTPQTGQNHWDSLKLAKGSTCRAAVIEPGLKGEDGDSGTGSKGKQGDKGDKGDTGAAGAPGEDGVDGRNGNDGDNWDDNAGSTVAVVIGVLLVVGFSAATCWYSVHIHEQARAAAARAHGGGPAWMPGGKGQGRFSYMSGRGRARGRGAAGAKEQLSARQRALSRSQKVLTSNNLQDRTREASSARSRLPTRTRTRIQRIRGAEALTKSTTSRR
mmetsp:Transcript_18052/g.45185  ORF Transcript_18052/g.45185 Transcript_18052/m.45185 type:complete len:320 (-) Transcript_18052:609-1568(-)